MSTTWSPQALAECMAPLDTEGRRALQRHWNRLIWEEWVPPSQRVPRAAPTAGSDGRRRREARRAVARIAAAGRLAPVVALPTSCAASAGSGVAA